MPTTATVWDAMKFWHRLSYKDFQVEILMMGVLLLYYLYYLLGSYRNKRLARRYFKSNEALFASQYAQVGSPRDGEEQGFEEQTSDGPATFLTYLSGRRHIAYTHVKVALVPRHDPIGYVTDSIGSLFFGTVFKVPRDTVTFEFVVSAKIESFVWAVVHKRNLRPLSADRYDLSFTKTSDHTALGTRYAVMSELSEVTDNVFGQVPELLALLPNAERVFEWLIVSDQPVDVPTRPDFPPAQKRLILHMRLPRTAADEQVATKLIEQALYLTDILAIKGSFRLEASRKLQNAREAAMAKIKKSTAKDMDLINQERKLEKERIEKERVSKLSAEEQRKVKEVQILLGFPNLADRVTGIREGKGTEEEKRDGKATQGHEIGNFLCCL